MKEPTGDRRRRFPVWVALAASVVAGCGGSVAREAPPARDVRARAVTLEGVLEHLEALQGFADANGGHRAAGSAGYDASARYVSERLEAAGYDVRLQEFAFPGFEQLGPTTVEIAGSTGPGFGDGRDFKAMVYSAAAAVEAAVTPVDFDPNAVGGQGAGCSSSDFTDFREGSIALLQPGPCFRRDQVVNAQTAGAVAVVVSYPDWSAGTVRRPTLIEPLLIEVPALAASHDVGLALQRAAVSGSSVEITTETSSEERTTVNVIAESRGGDDGNVVMVGGHLDSTMDGPGMNDNGSGTATILELAEAMAAEEQTNKVRFAFWGAEELGLIGSSQYVEGLEGGELDDIALYLNFDMLASPNFVRFVYGDAEAPSGSDAIAEVFAGYLDSKGLDHESLDLQGGSDHGPFARAGVPVGGLFTGATEVKSISQVDSYGGTAAAPLDACYHLACDTVENVNERVLEEMAGAVAHAVATFASSTEAVDG